MAETLKRRRHPISPDQTPKRSRTGTPAVENGSVASARFANTSGIDTVKDYSDLPLKPDHMNRPIWIDPEKKRIVLESFSPLFKGAESFLINIAEPQSRVSSMHEYTLTTHSLFAAVSVGLTTEDIIQDLDRFSKTPLPDSLVDFITASTRSFGKARLVLKHNRYFVESSDPEVLQELLKDPIIGPCRVDTSEELKKEKASKMGDLVIPGTKMAAGVKQAIQPELQRKPWDEEDEDDEDEAAREARNMAAALLDEDDDDELDEVHSFEISTESVEKVRQRCFEIGLPLTEEYDFRNDEVNATLDINIKQQGGLLRDYQEKALNKMFGNGRARSGIIVLPCGAGKTLVGVTAACTVKKGVIVMCTSAMSVVQWKEEFKRWSNINPNDIAVFTAEHKERFPGNTGVVITTYSMVTASGKRAHDTEQMMNFITQREWGLMILDEVHVVPAEMFKKVVRVASHSKLGLTATLLREDDKIQDLNYLIGPKLYEANWQELSEQGHIARVQCAEVWCPMTTEFYQEYLRANSTNKRSLLCTMNPNKFQRCQFLINYHEKRGDKVIVFSDNVYALERYAKKLNKAYIYGGTPQAERMRILDNFRYNEQVNTIFLSKIGDTSLDLPEATCLIQVSSHYGSRRQEAQRLGRILRAKRRNDEGFNAFFYSLVSKDTNEMYYSAKRQAFLVDQGYAFKSITALPGLKEMPGLAFATPQERRELLTDVMLQNETAGDIEKIEGDLFSERQFHTTKNRGVKRTAGALSELSGGQDMAYIEYNKGRNKELRGKGAQNAFIRKLQRDSKKKK